MVAYTVALAGLHKRQGYVAVARPVQFDQDNALPGAELQLTGVNRHEHAGPIMLDMM